MFREVSDKEQTWQNVTVDSQETKQKGKTLLLGEELDTAVQ